MVDGNGIHLPEDEGVAHALPITHAHVHGIHDALEDGVRTGDPVLVRGVTVMHGQHVRDLRS